MKDIWRDKKDKHKYDYCYKNRKGKYFRRYNYWIRGFYIEEKQAQIGT